MSPLINLLLLLGIAAFCMIAWRYWQQRADEKLRNNPPQRRVIEVSLPVGVADSATSMARFYRKAAAAALGDKGARRVGARQIDFVYLVDVPAEGALPRLKCRIYADPDKMDAVKKALKSSFHDAIDVLEMKEDDLLPLAKMLRPEEGASPEESDAEFAPEDIRALLKEGQPEDVLEAEVKSSEGIQGDKEEVIAEHQSDSEKKKDTTTQPAKEDRGEEIFYTKEDTKREVFYSEEDVKEKVLDPEEEKIDDRPPPPKPQKQGGVQTIDFIIGEEEVDET